MQLVCCQSCGHLVDTVAKFCSECGQRRDVAVLVRETIGGELPILDRRTESVRPRCPGCAGEQFRKLSLIYANGVSHVSSSTSGVGISLAGALGVGRASTQGKQVTELALQAAPPEPMSVALMAGAGVMIGLLAGLLLAGAGLFEGIVYLLPIVLGGAAGVLSARYNRQIFTPAYARWQRKFMCDRCGEIFTL